MAFVHANGQTGTLPAPLTATATSVTLDTAWTGASGTAKLVFDPPLPGARNAAMEIVYATVANGSASATALQRGQEGTTAQAHNGGATWLCGYTGLDLDILAPLASPTFTGTVTVPAPTTPGAAVTKQYTDTTVGATGYAVASFGPLGTADDGPTLQAAATNALTNPGRYFLPPGSFTVVTRPTFNASNFTLKGAGKGSTVLNWQTLQALQVFGTQPNGDGSTIQNVVNVELEDLTIQGAPAINNQFLLSLKWFGSPSQPGFTARRCAFNGDTNRTVILQAANNLIEQWGLTFEECDFVGHTTTNAFEAILLRDCERMKFYKCNFFNYQYAAVNLFTQLVDLMFDNCVFDTSVPNFITGQQGGTAGGLVVKKSTRKLTVKDCRFRGLWGAAALFDGEGAGSPDNYGWTGGFNWLIHGNEFYDCLAGIDLPGLTHFEISENIFEKLQNQGIRIGTSGFHAFQGTIRRNLFHNLGQGGGGNALTNGIYIKAAAANNTDNSVLVEENGFVDDQPAATMASGVVLDCTNNRSLYGWRFVKNDFTIGIATPVRVITGTFDPATTRFEDNPGYNPLYAQAGPILTSGKALLPTFNARSRAVIGGGTVTAINAGVIPPPVATPSTNPTASVNGIDLTGGGTGWTVTATNSVTPVYRSGANNTEGGAASPNFNVANATDQVLISPLPTPTVAPTLTVVAANSPYPAGTYTIGYTWYNDTGETPLSPTATAVLAGANGQFKVDLSALTVPSGALGAKVYVTASTGSPAVLGLCTIIPINAGNIPSVNANQINQLPFGIQPPAVAPVITDGGAVAGITTPFGGSSTVGITYVTTNNWESAVGVASGAVAITAGHVITIAQLNLDAFVIKALGQIAVSKVRYYLLTGTGAPGLLAEQYVQLPSSSASPAFVPAITVNGLLSSAAAPTYDISKPPNTQATPIPAGTCGWRVPAGVTAMRFYINQNGTVTFPPDRTPVNGVVRAFIASSPGTAQAIPTTNATGTSVATAAPAAANPLILPLPPGEALSVTFSVAPTVSYIAE